MSLTQGKSDLKKHLSRHIHVAKKLHPLNPATLPGIADSTKDQADTTATPTPALKPLA
jgi:hypothetical protein